jgi:hypothetical protein
MVRKYQTINNKKISKTKQTHIQIQQKSKIITHTYVLLKQT